MSIGNFNLQQNGDSAITLIFEDEMSETLTKKILSLKDAIANISDGTQLTDIIPAYQSLTLYYAAPFDSVEKIKVRLTNMVKNLVYADVYPKQSGIASEAKRKLIKIPVCYQEPYAPDLQRLASLLEITPSELIEKHTSGNYLVHMLGFLPGFLYLGGLHESLHYPRKETPAINVDKGSVGIGGQQTGIYPVQSPGGWHIIGRCPLTMFDANRKNPTIAEPLDEIKFYSISSKEFIQLETKSPV